LLVVSLDFRQGSEHKHPAASADVAAGGPLRACECAPARNRSPPRRLVGSSSGGHLALLAGVKPGAPEHASTPIVSSDGSLDATAGDESVAFVLALYPVADSAGAVPLRVGRQDDGSGFDAKRLIAATTATSRARPRWRRPA